MRYRLRNGRKIGPDAFTLVELIVVIAILAILATVGFLSLSGYSDDARSAAVTANVRTVYSAILTESTTSGNSPRYYVDHDPAAALSGAVWYGNDSALALTGGQFGEPSTNYSAGNPRWDRLKMNGEKFKLAGDFRGLSGFGGLADGAFAAYSTGALGVGAVDVAGKPGLNGKARPVSYFQVSGLLKNGKSSVIGNYAPGSGGPGGLVKDPNSANPLAPLVDSQSSANLAFAWSDPSLVGFWDMRTVCAGGSCGTGNDGKLKDLSGKGNHGACMDLNAPFACGTSGKGPQIAADGMLFNSGSDTKIIAGTGGISTTSPITVVLKAKFNSFANQNGFVYVTNSASGNRYLYSSTWTPDGTNAGFHAGTLNSSGTWGFATGGNASYFATNVWYVIAYVVNPMEGYSKVYGDNALLQAYSFAPFPAFYGSPANVWIGGFNESSTQTMNGTIDEVRVYNRALSDAELASITALLKQ